MPRTKQYQLWKIKWDTDGPSAKSLGLPRRVSIVVDADFDVGEDGADLLSDEYGYCVFSFMYKEVKPPKGKK